MVIISQLMVIISPVIIFPLIQWPFQEPKLEVPTIYKAYVRGYTPKIWPYMVQYLHFRILKFPLIDHHFFHIIIINLYQWPPFGDCPGAQVAPQEVVERWGGVWGQEMKGGFYRGFDVDFMGISWDSPH